MKAVASIWKRFRHEKVHIPKYLHTPQHDHDEYQWITQDNRVIGIREIEDNHLMNIYNMLTNTILYAKQMQKHHMLTYNMKQTVMICNDQLIYIGYELYRRTYGTQNKRNTGTKATRLLPVS